MVLHGLGELSLSKAHKALASTSHTNLIYAQPAKMLSHAKYALANGVTMTVFDGEDELYKLASLPGHENFELLLRLATGKYHNNRHNVSQ
jgi:diaminopimelate decarboxylase